MQPQTKAQPISAVQTELRRVLTLILFRVKHNNFWGGEMIDPTRSDDLLQSAHSLLKPKLGGMDVNMFGLKRLVGFVDVSELMPEIDHCIMDIVQKSMNDTKHALSKADAFSAKTEANLQSIDDKRAALTSLQEQIEKAEKELKESNEKLAELYGSEFAPSMLAKTEVPAWEYEQTLTSKGCRCGRCSAPETTIKWVDMAEQYVIDSVNLETLYQDWEKGPKHTQVTFTEAWSEWLFNVDFGKMVRSRPGTTERIRRVMKAIYLKANSVDMSAMPQAVLPLALAVKSPIVDILPYYCTPADGDEDIKAWFFHTMGIYKSVKITSIERIIHPVSARLYEAEKERMADKTEMILFHASPQPRDAILAEGLDMRLSRIGNTGRAIYLADEAHFSHRGYGGGSNRMYVVRCLVGKVSKGGVSQSLRTAPPGFDSAWHQQYSTGIYAVYSNSQCYITHCIEYQ
jgi:hypothetical protein